MTRVDTAMTSFADKPAKTHYELAAEGLNLLVKDLHAMVAELAGPHFDAQHMATVVPLMQIEAITNLSQSVLAVADAVRLRRN